VLCVLFLLCYGKLSKRTLSAWASRVVCGLSDTKQECVLWWGVNYSGRQCLRGHPGHRLLPCLGSAVQRAVCVHQHLMFHVSVKRVNSTGMNVVGGMCSWLWTVTAHCSGEGGKGKLTTFSLIL